MNGRPGSHGHRGGEEGPQPREGPSCAEEAGKLAREYGMAVEEAERAICLLGVLAFRALHPVAERLGLDLSRLQLLEVDPEGPRVILRLGGWDRFREVYIDMSADGVEMVATIEARRGLDKRKYEDAIAAVIEEGEQFQGVEEYDVSYSPEEGTATLTLVARMVAELPSLRDLAEAVERALGYMS